jgi:hypothetical protein
MVQIVLTTEQVRLLSGAGESVEIVDAHGNRVGYLARSLDAQDIAIARRRAESNEPRRTTQQVLQRIQSLENG